jgi:molybdopterin molybdotransferase
MGARGSDPPPGGRGAHSSREFFTVKTVAEALTGFRPARRTPVETVSLDDALGRVPAEPLTAPHALPGFARATVDGFAVRAADTFGASEGLPSYLDIAGEARMGRAPESEVSSGTAVAIATGAPLPPGADAVLKVEHTQSATPELLEVLKPVTPGEGMVRADEDAAPGDELIRAGRPLRPQDLGMLAAAGIVEVPVHARPRVAIISTGDELVPAGPRDTASASALGAASAGARDTASGSPRGAASAGTGDLASGALPVGQVRDSSGPALMALVREAGGDPHFGGIVGDDRDALAQTLRQALPKSDVLVVSAGSSVGARDETAAAIASLGEPGIWCHGLALRPGKPTLLADCGGVPVIGLPGNPRSALVVFRLIGMPIVRAVGGCTTAPPEPSVTARLARDLPSAAGRLDIVQIRLDGDRVEPLFGSSSLLSILTAADGYVTVPEAATGLGAGTEVEVTLYS